MRTFRYCHFAFALACCFALASLVLVFSPAVALAQPAGANFTVRSDASTVTYHIVHKLHRVDGVSKKVEGRARIQAGGPTQVAIRIPVESFDSGNVNRDAHMKETVEAARFPYVELKAAAEGIAVPQTFPTQIDKTWHAQITFHGVTQTLEIPVKVRFEAADRAVATANLSLSLDAFKIERPSLMFVKVDDPMKLDVSLTFGP
jgi:polyisoprenoid-binding protein YceI